MDVTASYDLYNTQIEVQWTDDAGETSYGIWRYTSGVGASATFVGSAAANATNYSDTTATPGTEYYYWVRATNNTSASQSDLQASGALGRRLDPNLPAVTTDDPTEITQSSAKGGGNVTDGGGDAVTERGVVWGTSLNPTTADRARPRPAAPGRSPTSSPAWSPARATTCAPTPATATASSTA